MSYGVKVTDCWGSSYYITRSFFPPYHSESQWGRKLTFISFYPVSQLVATFSNLDILRLCHRFTHKGQPNRQWIESAIYNGELKVLPEIKLSNLASDNSNVRLGNAQCKPEKTQHKVPKEIRSLTTIRSDIKMTLRQIVDQERIEAKNIEKQYQEKSAFGKTGAHISRFAHGLHGAGTSFLTWVKEVHDVVNLNQRLFRIMKAAATAELANEGQRYQVFKQTLAESEKKELVEALGFDPANIPLEKLKQVYELASMIYDDPLSRVIIVQFAKDYTDAQHSLELSEFSGGAAFEVILTALLAIATGGVGAIASLGAQSRKLSLLQKLGGLFNELAEVLKNIPKPKVFSLHKLKEIEDMKERHAEVRNSVAKPESEVSRPENSIQKRLPSSAKSVNELIDSDLDLSNSLNGKTGEVFKNNALIDYHLNPDMDVLTKDEYMSMHVYTTNLYKPINDGLRGLSPSDKEKWSKVAESADMALAKLGKNPKLKYEGYVTRGDEFSDALLNELFPVGGVHQDKGFKSSSANPDKAFMGNTTITILSKSGVKVEGVSVATLEQEVLFRPGTQFKVLNKKKAYGHNFIEIEEI